MELFELAAWQQLLLFGMVLIALVYVFYFKIWVAIASASDFAFLVALSVAVASIAAPALFDRASTALVDRSALPAALESADEKVAAIESLPSELIDRALAKLGYEPEPPNEDLPEPEPTPGPFESKIRPSVEALVAAVLRAASFLTATVLLLMALALRSSTSTARTLQALTLRTEALEAQLADKVESSSRDADREQSE
jgi:hypothetical protein